MCTGVAAVLTIQVYLCDDHQDNAIMNGNNGSIFHHTDQYKKIDDTDNGFVSF